MSDSSLHRVGLSTGLPALKNALSGLGASSAAQLAELSTIAAEAAEERSAEGFVRRILARVKAFEATLDANHEVGLKLVSFGQAVTIHVDRLAAVEPSLIVFIGKTGDGQPVQLVQHMSQVSFLLTALPRLAPEEPRKPIGFEVQK